MLKLIQRIVDGASAALLVAITALAFYQVLARYALGISTPWSEELLRLLFVWLILLGASRTAHMRIDMLEQAVGRTSLRILLIVQAVVAAALLGLLIVHGLDLVDLTAYDRYTALPLSVQWLYWSMVVGSSLWLIFMLAELTQKLRGQN